MLVVYVANGKIFTREYCKNVTVRNGRIYVSDAEGEEDWVTLEPSGTHVQLNGSGEVAKGPSELKGASVKKQKEVPATPHKMTAKTKHLVSYKQGDKLPDHFIKETGRPIPPNWRNVMVSHDPKADLQAIGKDAKNRTQYIYRKEYVDAKQAEKFERVQNVIKNKDGIIKGIRDLRKKDPDTSDCLLLISKTGIRPGSTKDTKAEKEALGATTLRGNNVVKEGDKVFLRFTGKKGVYQDHEMKDPEIKKMLLDRKKQAGDGGRLFKTSAEKLNKNLPPNVHAKDFRTAVAQESATNALSKYPKAKNAREFEKMRNSVGEDVSKKLGNTRSVALKSYINPVVFKNHSPEAYAEWERKQNAKA